MKITKETVIETIKQLKQTETDDELYTLFTRCLKRKDISFDVWCMAIEEIYKETESDHQI